MDPSARGRFLMLATACLHSVGDVVEPENVAGCHRGAGSLAGSYPVAKGWYERGLTERFENTSAFVGHLIEDGAVLFGQVFAHLGVVVARPAHGRPSHKTFAGS